MGLTTPLIHLCREYTPPEELRGIVSSIGVESIKGDRTKKEIIFECIVENEIEDAIVSEIEEGIKKQYKLDHIMLKIRHPNCELCGELFEKIIDRMRRSFPSVKGFMNDCECRFDRENRKLTIILKNGGIEFLEGSGVARRIENIMDSEYGKRVRVEFGGRTEVEQSELEASDEADRARLMREAASEPAPKSAPQPKQEVKKAPPKEGFNRYRKKARVIGEKEKVLLGKPLEDDITPMKELRLEMGNVTVAGEVFAVNHKVIERREMQIVNFDMTDNISSIRISKAMDLEGGAELAGEIKPGEYLIVSGQVTYDNFDCEMIIRPTSILKSVKKTRKDTCEKKRVELHMHTNMSAMDAVSDVGDLIKRAKEWGHTAIAITDHGVAQAFPDAMKAAQKAGIKAIYGVEGYYKNTKAETPVVSGPMDAQLDDEIVVFDIETTGLTPVDCEIIEIGAVVLKGSEIKEEYSTFVKPTHLIPTNIQQLTGITDEMVQDARGIEEVLPEFVKFINGRPLCAHNASFDVGFIENKCEKLGLEGGFTYIDTLELSRILMPELSKHKLNVVAEAIGAGDFNHHRACDDARVCAKILAYLTERMMNDLSLKRFSEVNETLWKLKGERTGKKRRPYHHIVLLVKNQQGLYNLYKIISEAHLKYFKTRPIIPRELLEENREGLIVGSACESGELYEAVIQGKTWNELRKIARFYDYLEIQPLGNNEFLVRDGKIKDIETIKEMNRTIVKLGQAENKPVVATCDVHFLDPHDEVYRRILMAGQHFKDADNQAPLYLRTTDEMLEEFSYLGQRKAYEVVVENTNLIADMCDNIRPVVDGTYPPTIEGAAEDLQRICYENSHKIYGDPLPQEIKDRISAELTPIINNGFAVMYMSAQKLIKKSNDAGYLVGSRGSVGSSFVAYACGISEVNPLAPHYICDKCKSIEIDHSEKFSCGADMPDKMCPNCNIKYRKDGFNIPFFTFLGFKAEKEPDIDLNFAGEYQSQAHRDCVELFGEGQVFKAGTIGTLADKTAYGFVRKYADERGMSLSKAEMNRLTVGCTGVKRTTGQHPGGLIIVPRDHTIYEFCPVQHPADDPTSDIITTHFDFHSIHDNLLKLDMLGHDNPTIIKHLEDMTGTNAGDILLDDPRTIGIFTDIRNLYDVNGNPIEPDEILGKTGAAAVPEFGTRFSRQMLLDTQPKNFDGLVRISGLSHGTDVWLGNAAEIIKEGTATLNEVISARDDITMFLIAKGMEPSLSFKTSEAIRKGKGIIPETVEIMKEHGVPDWYIESCQKIKYLYPKAHAVAYVMMAFRIAWYKVHYPLPFYSSYFSIRAVGFDASTMTHGIEKVKAMYEELSAKPDATANEKDTVVTLEVVYEFYKRGFTFKNVDVYDSEAEDFIIEGNSLRPPLTSLPGLGATAARDIVEERKKGEFSSIDEIVQRCPKVGKSVVELLSKNGALRDMPESDQISMF